jgi:hypothetical protein
MGCGGVDLLAYRRTEADPLDLGEGGASRHRWLSGGGRQRVDGRQIADLKSAGAMPFTIGSAVFDGSFSPRKGSIGSRLPRRDRGRRLIAARHFRRRQLPCASWPNPSPC